MRFKPTLLVMSLTAALGGLVACGGGGGSGSSGGSPTAGPSATSGTLVDDLVAGATVFCDSNENQTLDDGEMSATTGDDGTYTFSAACSASIVSVADTGLDRSSLKAPKGHFRARAGSTYVSPFTTMLAESGLSLADFKAVMTKLGLGSVDPGSFNPVADVATKRAAAAVAKLFNEIAAIAAANGADAPTAFKAALTAFVGYVNSHPVTGGSLIDDDSTLAGAINAALTAGFADLSWDNTQKTNAQNIASASLQTLAKAIKNAANDSDFEDAFRHEGTSALLDDTDLHDSSQVNDALGRCQDQDNWRKPRYVYSAGDVLTLIGTDTSSTDFTLTALADGVTTPLTLRTLARVEMPLRDAGLALPKEGLKAKLGIEVTEVGGNRTLKLVVDKVQLKPGTGGLVNAVVDGGAKLDFLAVSSSGVELYPAQPLVNLSRNVLSSGDVVGIDLSVITNRIASAFSSDTAKTALLDHLLDSQGTFRIKVVISEIDFRMADKSKLPFDGVRLSGGKKVYGASFTGQITFGG